MGLASWWKARKQDRPTAFESAFQAFSAALMICVEWGDIAPLRRHGLTVGAWRYALLILLVVVMVYWIWQWWRGEMRVRSEMRVRASAQPGDAGW